MPRCDICDDRKTIRLPIRFAELTVAPVASVPDCSYREFDCPQCVPMVPYRRVRAMKVATAYEAEQFARYQVPIERGLAARFGEYLLREGLIRFSTTGSPEMPGPVGDKVTITAHLGVVSREDVKVADAAPEVAFSSAPPLPKKLTRQERERVRTTSPRAVRWEPKPAPWAPDADRDEFDEPKSAIDNRFSGLEL
jgi:hypothetical protein